MDQLVTGEAPEAAPSGLQKELAEVLRQRAAISAVLRAIANSPHDLQPIARLRPPASVSPKAYGRVN